MTRHNAHLYLPIIQAFADGEEIQAGQDDSWHTVHDLIFCDPPDRYRIKPQPVMVPLKSADWMKGGPWWVKYSRQTKTAGVLVIGVDSDATIYIHGDTKFTAAMAMEELVRSNDGEDWQPCHKPAPAAA